MPQPLFTIPPVNPAPTPDYAPDIAPVLEQTEALAIPLGAPIPDEDKAFSAFQYLHSTKGTQPADPAFHAEAVKTWTTYRDLSKSYERKLFPSRSREWEKQQAANQEIYLSDLAELPNKLPAQQAQALTGYLSRVPEADKPALTARAANKALLDQAYGKPITPQHYETARNHYAKTVLGLDEVDDLSFHKALRERHQIRQDNSKALDFTAEILHARILAGDKIDMQAEIKAIRETYPEDMQEAAIGELTLRTRDSRNMTRRIAPLGDAMMAYIASSAGETPPPADPRNPTAAPIKSLGEAAARMKTLNAQDRALVFDYVGMRLKNLPTNPDQSTGDRMGTAFSNTAESGARAAGNFLRKLVQMEKESWTGQRGRETVSAKTQEERALLDDFIQLSGAIQSKTYTLQSKPKPSDTWAKLSLIAAAENMPYMLAAAAGGAGTVYNGLQMAGYSYQDARIRNPDANADVQFLIAAASGAAQAVIETASTRYVTKAMGILPGHAKSFVGKNGMESIMRVAKIRSGVARAGIGAVARAGNIMAVEIAEEATQDTLDRSLQDLAALATGDNPVDAYGTKTTLLKNLKSTLAGYTPGSEPFNKVFLSVLPLALIGGGVGGFQNFANGVQLQRNATALRAVGVPENIVAQITTAPNVEQANDLMKQAFETELHITAKEQANQYATDLADYTASLETGAAALVDGGALIREELDPETNTPAGYTLNLPEQAPQSFATELEAQEALYHWSQQTQDEYTGDALEALVIDEMRFLTGQGQAFDDPQFRPEVTDVEGTFDNLIQQGIATKQEIENRLEIYAMQEGLSMPEARAHATAGKLRIYARNYAKQVSKSSWKYVIEIMRGADPVNMREDFAEAYWKAGMDNGLIHTEEAIGWIRSLEAATGNTYLAAGYDGTNAETMPLFEALGKASIEYALSNRNSPAGTEKFARWVDAMMQALGTAWKWFKTMARGADLQAAIESKQVPQKFTDMLADSVGLNEQSRERRIQAAEEANALAEMRADLPTLTDRIKGKLLHPARAAQDGNPLARELSRIYEGLTTSKRKFVSTVDRRYHTYVIKAEQFFAPRTEKVNLDNLRGTLVEEGFQFASIAEMLEAVNDSLFYGREHYATHSGIHDSQSFSMGRATVTPTPDTQTWQGAEGSPTVIGPASFSLSAHHGTPHNVDKFSLDKIGTGEGAQAYGWGLYFAQDKAVGEQYQKNLSGGEYVTLESIRKFFTVGNLVPSYAGTDRVIAFNEDEQGGWYVAVQAVDKNGEAKRGELPRTHSTRPSVAAVKAAGLPTAIDGNLYTVELDVNDEDLLDWDKPLSEQSEKVKAAWLDFLKSPLAKKADESMKGDIFAKKGSYTNPTGSDFMGALSEALPYESGVTHRIKYQKKLNQFLMKRKVSGIRYLDGNSRTDGKGTYNYVIFDESKIKITEENGQPVNLSTPDQSFSLGRSSNERLDSNNTITGINTNQPSGANNNQSASLVKADLLLEKLSQKHALLIELETSVSIDKIDQSPLTLEYEGLRLTGEINNGNFFLFDEDNPDNTRTVPLEIDEYTGTINDSDDAEFTGEWEEDTMDYEAIPFPDTWWNPETDIDPNDSTTWAESQPFYEVQTNDPETGWTSENEPTLSLKKAVDQYLQNSDSRLVYYTGQRTRKKINGEWMNEKIIEILAKESFEDKIYTAFPSIPQNVVPDILDTKNDENENAEMVVEAYVRHNMTDYDARLEQTDARDPETGKTLPAIKAQIRREVRADIDQILDSWSKPPFSSSSPNPSGDSISFSLSADTQHNLETIIAARIARGPAERITALETMRQRIQSAVYKAERRSAHDLTDMEKQLLGWRGKGDLTPAQQERLRIEDALATIKGIVSALPAEIRHTVSVPLTRILDAETDIQTTNALKELIQEADNQLEEYLQELYIERIAAILDTARPTSTESRSNKTLLTPETQSLINDIDAVVAMTPDEIILAESAAEARLEALTTQLDEMRANQAEQADIHRVEMELAVHTARMQHLATFAGLTGQSATELAAAHGMLLATYTRGRTARRLLDQNNRIDLSGNRKEIAHALGKPDGVTGPAYDRATAASTKKSTKWATLALALESVSFYDTLAILLPASLTANTWATRALTAVRGVRRRRMAADERWKAFYQGTLGLKNKLAYNKLITKLSERRAHDIDIREFGSMLIEKIPVEKIPDILAGKLKFGWTSDMHAMAQLRQAWRDYQLLPKKKRSRIESLKVQLIETRKAPVSLYMSDLEMLDVLQTYAQDGYRAQLDKYGFTEEVIAKIRQAIAPEALAIGEFLRLEYDNGWYELNPTFQRIYHMDMPRIRNYAPGAFHSFNDSAGAQGSPMGTAQGTASAMNPGFGKNRRAHMARMATSNALQKYWAHVESSSYWIEWAELSREMSATLRAPETRRTLEATHGKAPASKLYQWLDTINSDGADKSRAILETDKFLGRLLNARSAAVLSWNMGVPFKQMSAMFSSMTHVPEGAAMKAFARLLDPSQWQQLKTIFQSEAIQQRIHDGFSPEQQALMDASKMNPSALLELLHLGRLPTSYTDAAFTTLSGFIAYDYHYRAELAMNASPERAHQLAMQAMDRTVLLTAQPVDTTTKSLPEALGKTTAKLFLQFKSDPRRAMGAIFATVIQQQQGTKTKRDVARVIATQWLLYGFLGAVGTAAFKSLAHDDDDHEDYWSWDRLLTGALLGPIEGLMLLGDVIALIIRKSLDQKNYTTESNILAATVDQTITMLSSDKPLEEMNWQALTTAAATFAGGFGAPQAAIVPALLKGGTQLVNIADNATTSPEERLATIASEYDATAKQVKKSTEETFTDTLAAILAAAPDQREALMEPLDKSQRARVRSAIEKQRLEKEMSPLELSLARMTKAARPLKARYIYQNLTDQDEREAFQSRMLELFEIDVTATE